MSGRPREFKDSTVIDSAMDVFWVKGFEECSTEDLCKHTGLGRGSLYNAFGSKHNLYKHVLLRYFEHGHQANMEILERPGPIKDRLRALMETVIDIDMNDPDRRGCLAINAAIERGGKDPEVAGLVSRHFAQLDQALCHLMALGQRSGEISSKRPALELARFFKSSFYGLRVLSKVEKDRDALLDVVEGTLAAL
ncbi:TetR/AcrR family transcriptional regulator [Paenibacillus sp. sptzw28]|uniref:TetR/AcrR family transcriptional regulator n=1 Tax=Paenibacillus sp. sptzw28 TaxID=715179 RepID=UPI00216393C0|nr:TetR/AcrR family transcriptional regulator [Paenibacillus sp. sptzw28]